MGSLLTLKKSNNTPEIVIENKEIQTKISPLKVFYTGHSNTVLCVISLITKNSNNNNQLTTPQFASCGKDHNICLWRESLEERIAVLSGHTNFIRSLIQINDGSILSASDDNTLRLWDIINYTCLKTIFAHKTPIRIMTMLTSTSNPTLFATSSIDGTIKIWNATSIQCITVHKLSCYDDNYAFSLLHTKENYLIVSYLKSNFKVFDFCRFKIIKRLNFPSGQGQIFTMTQLKNGWLCSAGTENEIKLWNQLTFTCIGKLLGHEGTIFKVLQLNDGRLLSCSGDREIRVWNIETFECEAKLIGHGNTIYSMIELENKIIISASGDHDLRKWSLNMINSD